MAPDINGARGRRLEDAIITKQQGQKQEITRMVERTKSAPLQDLAAAKGAPRFPKNTSRSLSPKPRFPGNPSRSRSQPAKRERKQNAKRAAKESLLDSASQLAPDNSLSPDTKASGEQDLKKTPKTPLRHTKSEAGEPSAVKRTPKSPLRYSKSVATAESMRHKSPGHPLRASTGSSSELKTPHSPKDAAKSPSRRGRKETVGGNRSTSKLPAISPLHTEEEDANKPSTNSSSSRPRSPRARKEGLRGTRGNNSASKLTLDEDDSIDSTEKPQGEGGEADHWADIPPPDLDRHRSERYSIQSKPKDVTPTNAKNDNLSGLPTTSGAKPGALHTPLDNSISSRPKSPQRKGSKEAIKNGNSSSSRLPQLSPLHKDDDNTDGNNAAWDPFNTTSEDPFKAQQKTPETADGPKRIPPKQRSRGARKPGAHNGQSTAFKRSTTGEHLGKRSNHGESSSAAEASFKRSHTVGGERPRVERGQRPDGTTSAAAIATGRKTSMAPPRHHKPANALRGRAESILNHPLLGPGSNNQLDMSMSQSEATNADGSQVVPNHQRRRGLDQDASNRSASPSAEPQEASRNSVLSQRSDRCSLSGRKGRSSVPGGHDDKDRRRLRKSRSSPEGSIDRSAISNKSASDSPDNTRNQRWTTDKRHARSRDPVNARRARSRQRPDDMAKTDDGVDEVARLREFVKNVNGDHRQMQSHSPVRPRGRPAGAAFPRNVSRSISPSRGRGRGANPAPGSKHRRVEPSRERSASPSSSKHRRTAGGAPSGSRHKRSVSPSKRAQGRSSPSGQRESSQRGGRSSPGNSQRDLSRPRSSSSQRDLRKSREEQPDHRPSLLSIVLDKRNSDGHESDSSHQSDAIKTVVQFDPTKSASVASYKPSPNDPSLNNSGVFRMENLKNKEDLEDGSGADNSGYLPGNMSVSQQKASSPQSEGRRRRQSEQRRQSSRSSRRSPRDGRRVRGGRGDGNPRESLRRTQSLTMNEVFDDGSRSESFLEDDNDGSGTHRDSVASHSSAATFNGHGSDRDRSRRGNRRQQQARLRQRLRQKEQQRQSRERDDEDESQEDSPYLPANMAKSLSPPRSAFGDQAKDAPEEQLANTDDDEDDDEEGDNATQRSSTFSFVRQQLKNQRNQIKNEVNVLTNRVRGLGLASSSQGSSSFNLDSDSESVDSHNKNATSKSESKGGVSKIMRGLFSSKSKKHMQLLGGGESDSDYSAGIY